jgi:2-keto-4-pentenoate hydratase
LHADTEVAVELGSDVDPMCDASPAAAAIDRLGVGLELVDLARPPSDLEGIVAANVLHRTVAFGPAVAPEGPLDAEARSVVNGHVRAGGRARSDYGETVQTVARLLGAVGERLRRGDRILAGSFTQVPVRPGDQVLALTLAPEWEPVGEALLPIKPPRVGIPPIGIGRQPGRAVRARRR